MEKCIGSSIWKFERSEAEKFQNIFSPYMLHMKSVTTTHQNSIVYLIPLCNLCLLSTHFTYISFVHYEKALQKATDPLSYHLYLNTTYL